MIDTRLARAALLLLLAACLRRPISKEEPTTKISFETAVSQPAIDKVDVLVMVDSSASMADKQRILADAVPDLVRGLVSPKCVDRATRIPTGATADPTRADDAMCAAGSEPAFPPVTDMHIGVLSSSLGGMGSDQCAGATEDDHGRLLARGPRGDVPAAGDLHFLAWFPDVERNRDRGRHPTPPVPAIGDAAALTDAFRDLVVGVGQRGCGLEAQLESVYRFLVQPDPWTRIDVSSGTATYGPRGAVDAELLRQRAAFLRPDSLVAVIMLTDEDDSSADPLSYQGSGFRFMSGAPRERATAACATSEKAAECTSCAFAPGAPGCAPAKYAPAEDPLAVRFHHMKRRYGVDPQFPIARYVDALTKPRVPRRDDEHDVDGRYAPAAGCTNPLFAARLPTSETDELCALPRGPRARSLVYFGLIGGVPNALLPSGARAGETIDWTRIVGRDPAAFDESGIDPHMIQSTAPRPKLPPPAAADDADPVHGREWTTGGDDLQLACSFPLYERTPEGGAVPVRRVCSLDDRAAGLCDCDGSRDVPLCAADDRAVQVRGKAYPTRRQLLVAKELGDQGIVASLCPEQLTAPNADDYGYRPAVRSITARLERSLVGSCLPRALARDGEEGRVSCLVLAILPETEEPEAEVCGRFGLAPPNGSLRDQVRARLEEEDGPRTRRQPVCQVPQIVVPPGTICRDSSPEIAFCYAEAPAVTQCAHALAFTNSSARLAGARFTMQCIQQRTPADEDE